MVLLVQLEIYAALAWLLCQRHAGADICKYGVNATALSCLRTAPIPFGGVGGFVYHAGAAQVAMQAWVLVIISRCVEALLL